MICCVQIGCEMRVGDFRAGFWKVTTTTSVCGAEQNQPKADEVFKSSSPAYSNFLRNTDSQACTSQSSEFAVIPLYILA